MKFVLNKEGYPMLDISYSGRNSYHSALERAQVRKANSRFIHWFMSKYMKSDCRIKLNRTNMHLSST